MDWGVFMRRPNAAAEAERTYTVVVAHIGRSLGDLVTDFDFVPWDRLRARAAKDSAAVKQVQAFAGVIRDGSSLTPPDAAELDSGMASAVAAAYDFVTDVVGLKELPTSLAAGWCWLQWSER